jgi:hypothetical protein
MLMQDPTIVIYFLCEQNYQQRQQQRQQHQYRYNIMSITKTSKPIPIYLLQLFKPTFEIITVKT